MTIFNHNFNGFPADTDLGTIPNWLLLQGATGNVKINADGTLTLANSQACYVTMVDSSDFTYTVTFSAAMRSHPAKIVFRAMDERHFLGIGYLTADGGFSIYKCVAGTTTKISNIAITAPAIGDVWKVVCVGSSIKVYINDVLKFDIVETKYQYVNAVGFRTLPDSSLNNMIDSISIDTVPVASTGMYKSHTLKRIIGGFTWTSVDGFMPANTVAGDLLIAFLFKDSSTATNAFAPPAGWTVASTSVTNGSWNTIYLIAYKVATSSNENLTFTTDSSTMMGELVILNYGQVANVGQPIVSNATSNTGSSVSPVANTITVPYDNSKLLSFAFYRSAAFTDDNTAVPPTGMSLVLSNHTRDLFNKAKISIAEQTINVGASGTRTWTNLNSGAAYWGAVNLVINASASSLDSINGSTTNPTIEAGANTTVATTGLGATRTASLIGGGFTSPQYSITGNAFTPIFPYVDGTVQPPFGTVTASISDGSVSVTKVGTYQIPSGYTQVTFAGVSSEPDALSAHYAIVPGMVMYAPTINGFTCNNLGEISVTSAGTIPVMFHNLQGGGDGSIVTKNIIVTTSDTNVTIDLSAFYRQTESPYFDGEYYNLDRP